MKLSATRVLGALPPATLRLVRALIAKADEKAAPLHLVGGPVRDLLLERTIRDVDLVVEANGSFGAAELARAAAPRSAKVEEYDRFGTVRISTADAEVDVATARRESYRHAGALPRVEPGTLEEDLLRRDFSVNALAVPLRPGKGRVDLVDPTDGEADLASRVLRTLHDKSFHDDPTRALRAARLAPRLGFHLARGSRAELRTALRDGAFGAVSGERLRREFEKLFDDPIHGLDPAAALRLLNEWHVLSALEPGLGLPREVVAPIRRLGRAVAAPPWRGPRLRAWASGLAIWLSPMAPSLRAHMLERLSIRGELTKRIGDFPALSRRVLGALAKSRGRGAVDGILAGIAEEELYALHAGAPTPVQRRIVRWAAEDRARRPPISGDDLTAAGIAGPAVGRALARVRLAYLDGAVANREEALALAIEVSRSGRRR